MKTPQRIKEGWLKARTKKYKRAVLVLGEPKSSQTIATELDKVILIQSRQPNLTETCKQLEHFIKEKSTSLKHLTIIFHKQDEPMTEYKLLEFILERRRDLLFSISIPQLDCALFEAPWANTFESSICFREEYLWSGFVFCRSDKNEFGEYIYLSSSSNSMDKIQDLIEFFAPSDALVSGLIEILQVDDSLKILLDQQYSKYFMKCIGSFTRFHLKNIKYMLGKCVFPNLQMENSNNHDVMSFNSFVLLERVDANDDNDGSKFNVYALKSCPSEILSSKCYQIISCNKYNLNDLDLSKLLVDIPGSDEAVINCILDSVNSTSNDISKDAKVTIDTAPTDSNTPANSGKIIDLGCPSVAASVKDRITSRSGTSNVVHSRDYGGSKRRKPSNVSEAKKRLRSKQNKS